MKKKWQDRIYDLMARKFSGEASSEELAELQVLLSAHPDFNRLQNALSEFPKWDNDVVDNITDQAYASQYVKMMYADEKDTSATLSMDHLPKRKEVTTLLLWRIGAVAASLFIILSLVHIFSSNNKTTILADSDGVSNNKKTDTRSNLTLPDGTIVYLNTNSHLEYDDRFNKKERNVTLTGEAFFEVTHNPEKPFIVHTDKAAIKVLGTKFNVKSYDNESWETTLLEGKIEMNLNERPKEKLQLQPSQKVSITDLQTSDQQKEEYKVSITKIKPLNNDVVETAWMADKLIFVDKPMEEIAKELERRFGVSVVFLSGKTKQYKYTGAFQNDNLTQILKILDMTQPIQYELKDNVLMIQ
ncbi:MAG TPA: FecR family protein [Niabella sp.]|nr:FecR family protein [Niabella sp.]HQW15092.1 FecR family protein [Niabella sp.]HQX20233.1 FecR family protein [Niabella sp.]HQX41313.1 FecR family protein [Niabella sp.]HRB07354.1 FecR family protein [Niabella sp.]